MDLATCPLRAATLGIAGNWGSTVRPYLEQVMAPAPLASGTRLGDQLHIGLVACSRAKVHRPAPHASCTSRRCSVPRGRTRSVTTVLSGGSSSQPSTAWLISRADAEQECIGARGGDPKMLGATQPDRERALVLFLNAHPRYQQLCQQLASQERVIEATQAEIEAARDVRRDVEGERLDRYMQALVGLAAPRTSALLRLFPRLVQVRRQRAQLGVLVRRARQFTPRVAGNVATLARSDPDGLGHASPVRHTRAAGLAPAHRGNCSTR